MTVDSLGPEDPNIHRFRPSISVRKHVVFDFPMVRHLHRGDLIDALVDQLVKELGLTRTKSSQCD